MKNRKWWLSIFIALALSCATVAMGGCDDKDKDDPSSESSQSSSVSDEDSSSGAGDTESSSSETQDSSSEESTDTGEDNSSEESTGTGEDNSSSENTDDDDTTDDTGHSSTESGLSTGGSSGGDSSSGDETPDVPVVDTISFSTLTVNGSNVYGKVSNETEIFSFKDEVVVTGDMKFAVSTDEFGMNSVLSKTIPLALGDNTVYVWAMLDDEAVETYTVTIRRRPLYEVSFKTDCNSSVKSQTVEEDSLALEPTDIVTKTGYTFQGWDYDFSVPVTDKVQIEAIWAPATDTPYTVEHYFENIENGEFTLQSHETQALTGTTEEIVTAKPKDFAHFTHIETDGESGTVLPDGSLVLKVYYTRNKYEIVFTAAGGVLSSGQETQLVKYGGAAVAPTYTREGYDFNGFDGEYQSVGGAATVTARWKATVYEINYVLNEGENHAENPATYTIEDLPISLKGATKDNAHFLGWYSDSEGATPCESINEIGGVTVYSTFVTTEGLKYRKTDDGLGYEVTAYSGADPEVYIAERYNNLPVTGIAAGAFSYNRTLTSVKIPETLISIESSAFSGCTALTYNEYENINYLGSTKNDYVFLIKVKTTEAASFKIHQNTRAIAFEAFLGCENLTSVEIPDGVKSIGRWAFANCTNLTNIKIPDSLTYLADGVFPKANLQYNEYQNGKYLGNENNPYLIFVTTTSNSITSCKIHNDTKFLFDSAFYECDKLTEVEIPCGVKSIGRYAFYKCSSLTDIKIPDGVRRIGEDAFYHCTGLTSVSIGEGVTRLEQNAFDSCYQLRTITIPNSIVYIGAGAFPYSYREFNFEMYETEDGYYLGNDENPYVVFMQAKSREISSCSISEKTKVIYQHAFDYCSELSEIKIPDGVTCIGDAFNSCTALAEVYIPDSVQYVVDQLFESNIHATVYCEAEEAPIGWAKYWASLPVVWDCNNNDVADDNCIYTVIDGTRYMIRDQVALLAEQPFAVKSLIIHGSITYKGSTYMVLCGWPTFTSQYNNLRSIVFCEGQTAIGYEFEPFFNACPNLRRIELPESLTTITGVLVQDCPVVIYCKAKQKPSGWGDYWNVSNCPVVWDCANNDEADDGYIYAEINNQLYSLKDGKATLIKQMEQIQNTTLSANITFKGQEYTLTNISENAFVHRGGWENMVIAFDGTKAQWEAIEKHDHWNCCPYQGETSVYGMVWIECSDETVRIGAYITGSPWENLNSN